MALTVTRETTAIAINPRDVELVPFHDEVRPKDQPYCCHVSGHCMEPILRGLDIVVVDPRRPIVTGDFIVFAYKADAADFEGAHPEDASKALAQIEANGIIHMLKQFVGYDGGELYARFLSPSPQMIRVPLRSIAYLHRVSIIRSCGLTWALRRWIKYFPSIGDRSLWRLSEQIDAYIRSVSAKRETATKPE